MGRGCLVSVCVYNTSESNPLVRLSLDVKMNNLLVAIATCVVILLSMTHDVTPKLTQLRSNFTYSCPDQHALNSLESTPFPRDGDRIWSFGCTNVAEVSDKICEWSGPVNDLAKGVNFKCGADKVLSGVASNFSGQARDRTWDFRCCELSASYVIHACNFTAALNTAGQPMNYDAPDGVLISGVIASYDRQHDRLWRFDHCCKYANMHMYASMKVCKYASVHVYASMQVCKYIQR